MRLKRITIEGYRSIRDQILLHIDPKVTVVLGANDHGKTNLLEALLHLNADRPFAESDLNYDKYDEQSLPHITFTFELDSVDKASANYLFQNHALAAHFERILANGSDDEEEEQPASDVIQTQANVRLALRILNDHAADYPEQPITLDTISRLISKIKDEYEQLRTHAQGRVTKAAVAKQQLDAATSAGQTAEQIQPLQRASTEAQAVAATAEQLAAATNDLLAQAEAIMEANGAEAFMRSIDNTRREVAGSEFDEVVFERKGIKSGLELTSPAVSNAPTVLAYFLKKVPRVELIRSLDNIPDKASRESLESEPLSFMRGIFYYAGIKKDEWDRIFERNDITTRRLREAAVKLTKTLSEKWSQGKELTFNLIHDSATKEIDLTLQDPSVKGRDTRASRRSTGFTYFFAMKTILHARTMEAPAASHLWLFDEPGLSLHPHGQQDLLSVLETLAQTNQLIYSTHSMFMINKNFPSRHRLVVKDDKGTRLDSKPYVANWRSAINALGLALPGTILFASRILLVEGDSDPIFLNALLQKLSELERLDVDLNGLSIIGTGDSKNTDALVRILCESAVPPKIAAVFDNDNGGEARQKKLQKLFKHNGIKSWLLDKGATIEDCLPYIEELFLPAVVRYAAKVVEKKEDEILHALKGEYKKFKPGSEGGLSAWCAEAVKNATGIDDDLSKVGIAREYAMALSEYRVLEKDFEKEWSRAMDVAEKVCKNLDLPRQTVAADQITR